MHEHDPQLPHPEFRISDNEQKAVNERFNKETKFWSEAYERTDVLGEIYRGRQRILLGLVDSQHLPIGANVLEVGCGIGFLSLSLAQRGFQVYAIDSASVMVEKAKSTVNCAKMENHIQVTTEDVHKLSFQSDSVDLAVGLGVVVWLHNLTMALAEVHRVLKPGGHLIMSVDNSCSVRLRGWLNFSAILTEAISRAIRKLHLTQEPLKESEAKAHFYSPSEFETYLKQAGFQKIIYVGFGFGPFTIADREVNKTLGIAVHQKLQKYSERRLRFLKRYSSQLIFKATKQ